MPTNGAKLSDCQVYELLAAPATAIVGLGCAQVKDTVVKFGTIENVTGEDALFMVNCYAAEQEPAATTTS